MRKFIYKYSFLLIAFFSLFNANAESLKKVEIIGNERISNETIIVYGEIKKGKDYSLEEIDNIIKNLYETKFFSKISTDFSNGILKIIVEENPIINSIVIQGEPAKKYTEAILEILSLKEKSSYIKRGNNCSKSWRDSCNYGKKWLW